MTTTLERSRALSLPPPFPIALSKIVSNYGFYCFRDDGGMCFHNFHSAYAAKHFLELIIDGKSYTWRSDNEIALSNGTRIRSEGADGLAEIIEYQFKPKELEWDIPEPYLTYYRQFVGHAAIEHTPSEPQQVTRTRRTRSDDTVGTGDITTRGAIKAKSKPVDKAHKVTRAKAKVKTGDYITISQICKELGHHPRVCRAMLRELKEPKPDQGWSWNKSDAERIRSKLRQRLK